MSAGLDVAVRGTARASGPSGWQRARRGARSATVWIVAALVLLLAAIIGFLFSAADEETRPLHWDSAAPEGGRALVEVLRSRGIEVRTTETLAEARTLAAQPDTALLVFDSDTLLDNDDAAELRRTTIGAGNPLVVVEPGALAPAWSPGVQEAFQTLEVPATPDPMAPDCDWATAQRAGTVTGTLERYAATGASPTVTACYHHPWDQAGYGAVTREDLGPATATVLGSRAWLANDGLDLGGNAALALGALGERDTLVYYYPDMSDPAFDTGDEPVLGPLFGTVPPAFWAAFLWLIPLVLAAMLWRGRRLGPLAVERLPVVVPPVETVIGRAGILQRSGARDSALAGLRTAALLRMAARLSLPRHARTADICDAIAEHTGRDPVEVHRILAADVARTDSELTSIATAIATLESEVSLR